MLWLPALAPMLFAALLFATRPQRRGLLALVAGLGQIATFALVLLAASRGWSASLPWTAALDLHASLTPLSVSIAALVPAVALPVLVYAAHREAQPGLARLIGLLSMFTGAMELLVVAADLLTLLIAWEIVGACSWALIAHEWREAANPRAAQYAFVMTRFGDLGLFTAAMAAYAGAGSFAYADLARLDPPHLSLVAFGVLLSAASKSGQVPFSPWLFRAMSGPSSVSALLHAATMVAAGTYLLARLQPVVAPVVWFGPAVMAIGIVTAFAAGVVALVQPHVKKLLAASTSAQFGLMFAAIGAGFPGVAMLHLIAHGFFKALLFLCAGMAIDRTGSHDLSEMRIGRALPVVAVLALIGSAALAGLPPLGAGWTKDAIVAAAAAAGTWWAVGVIVAGGLSAAYAVRWMWMSYGLRDDACTDAPADSIARGVIGALGWLAIASVLLSVLWLPDVRDPLAATLAITLPPESTWIIAAALCAVVIGASGGRVLAVRLPLLGHHGLAAQVADWWGLPTLIDATITRPVTTLARASARFDDAVIDAVPSAAGRFGRHIAASLASADTRLVDRGVRLATGFVEWLARTTSRIGEGVADGVALVPARLVGISGEDARRLQTGLSHHAFALLLGGALLLGTLLFAAGL